MRAGGAASSSDPMESSMSAGGPAVTGPVVTHPTSYGPRRNEPDEHNRVDERNSKKDEVTINDGGEKMGSNEETVGGTTQSKHDVKAYANSGSRGRTPAQRRVTKNKTAGKLHRCRSHS